MLERSISALDSKGQGESDFVKFVPDVVWGHIPISTVAYRLTQTRAFSRLKEIRQMGLAAVSFPGALHDRYQHSLGVMYVADRLTDMVLVRRANGGLQRLSTIIGEGERRALALAALLHDVGHPPLSHAVEEAFRKHPSLLKVDDDMDPEDQEFLRAIAGGPKGYSHENATAYLIEKDQEISEVLTALTVIRPSEIAKLAIGQATGERTKLLNCLIDSDMDADKLDYLTRDNYYCGIPTPFKIESFFDNILIDEATCQVEVAPEALTTIEAFLQSRQRLIMDIHHEKQHRIATQMIIDDIAETLKNCSSKERAQEIRKMHTEYDDAQLLALLQRHKKTHLLSVRKMNIPYKEALTIRFWDMSPLVRAHLYTLVSHPPLIVKFQEEMRKAFGEERLLVDIRMAKTTKFCISIHTPEESIPPSVLSRSSVAKGLLSNSVRDLKLHCYLPPTREQARQELEIGKIWDCITQVALSPEELRTSGFLFIVFVLKAVIDDASCRIYKPGSEKRKWIPPIYVYSQYRLQRFVQKLSVTGAYGQFEQKGVNHDFVHDLQVLTDIGLIQSRGRPISYLRPNDPLVPRGSLFRNDYTLTTYGHAYCDTLLNQEIIYFLYEDIKNRVRNQQNRYWGQLEWFYESEKEMEELRGHDTAGELDKENERWERVLSPSAIPDGDACLVVP